jgi:hypothetical protein
MAFFVRSINQAEYSQLSYLIETNFNNPAFLTQLRIIQLSSQRLKSGEISRQLKVSQGQVANCIKRFNKYGLGGLREITMPDVSKEREKHYRQPSKLQKATEYSEFTPSYYKQRQSKLYKNVVQLISNNNNSYKYEGIEEIGDFSLDTLRSAFQVWRDHPLDPHYLYVYLDETTLSTTKVRANVKHPRFMLALGVKLDGTKDFLNVAADTDWQTFIAELAERGFERANLWIMPINEIIQQAVQKKFGNQPITYSKDSLQQQLQLEISTETQDTVKQLVTEIYSQSVYAEAQAKVTALINVLTRESNQMGEWLQLRQDDLIYFYRMPRYHWYSLKSTHPVKEIFNLVGKWSRMLEALDNYEDWLLLFYCVFTSISYRRLKV